MNKLNIPKGAKWIAQDEDGEIYPYRYKPNPDTDVAEYLKKNKPVSATIESAVRESEGFKRYYKLIGGDNENT